MYGSSRSQRSDPAVRDNVCEADIGIGGNMKVLALDTSGLVATVAIMEDEKMLAEYTVQYKKTHSQTLLPMIREIVSMTETDLGQVDAIAVAGGPGSFTGLRIGSATAKGLGLALDKPIVSVPTVTGLAYNFFGYTDWICPLMDARRNQVYTGIYRFQKEQLLTYQEQCAVSVEALAARVEEAVKQTGINRVIFLGDGVPVHRAYLENTLTCDHIFAPQHMSGQRAGAVALCAMQMIREGKMESAAEHRPDYLRLSQAERERAERMSKG